MANMKLVAAIKEKELCMKDVWTFKRHIGVPLLAIRMSRIPKVEKEKISSPF
jgi:hypothetical protein